VNTADDRETASELEYAAAFFDLDKTVIAKASLAAFRAPLRANGLLSLGAISRAVLGQLIYLHLGAREDRIRRLSESLLRLATGWSQTEVNGIVETTLERVVDPIIYAEAIELIDLHRAAGDLVVIVSAAPSEIVVPLGRHLGVDDAIATRAELDEEGRYTGRIAHYAHGVHKAEAIVAFARERHVDLARSFAYSDSASDLPMLEAVGHPVAVNPDRVLSRRATAHDWEVRRFERPVRLRDRVSVPGPTSIVSATTVGVGAVAAVIVWRFGCRHQDVGAPSALVESGGGLPRPS
jgi:HAD superfamily hydrolase (TIGR01490 family)